MSISGSSVNGGDAQKDGGGFLDDQMRLLAGVLILCLLFALLSAALATLPFDWLRDVGVIAVVAFLGLAAGALIGFLFGLPKLAPPTATTAVGAAAPAPSPGSSRRLSSNTNLEEVSDWVTKIIVGLGIAQLTQANTHLLGFEAAVKAADPKGGDLVALCATITLCASAIVGFLGMYLEARIVLSRVFDDTEKDLVDNLTTAVAQMAGARGVSDAAMGPAADALQRAATLKPDDSSLRAAAVKALTVAGRGGAAASLLQSAPDRVRSTPDQISQMFLDLYDPPPGGYEAALKLAQALEVDPTATGRPDFWFYKAAALGQKLTHQLPQRPLDETSVLQTRTDIVDSVQKCLALDQHYKQRFYDLAHPKPGSQDDDLKDMAGYPPFDAAIGA
jgi:hypothetical protein